MYLAFRREAYDSSEGVVSRPRVSYVMLVPGKEIVNRALGDPRDDPTESGYSVFQEEGSKNIFGGCIEGFDRYLVEGDVVMTVTDGIDSLIQRYRDCLSGYLFEMRDGKDQKVNDPPHIQDLVINTLGEKRAVGDKSFRRYDFPLSDNELVTLHGGIIESLETVPGEFIAKVEATN